MKNAIYPGSFDPLHNGHFDVIKRASKLYEHLTVAVVHNPLKPVKLFELNERLKMIQASLEPFENITVEAFEGLLVRYAQEKEAVILKGLRTVGDFEYEMQMAQMNRHMADDVETVFLLTSPPLSFISSTRVREVAALGVDVAELVPATVKKALADKLGH